MSPKARLASLLFASLLLAACAGRQAQSPPPPAGQGEGAQAAADAGDMRFEAIPALREPRPGLYTAAQPTAAQIEAAAAHGVRTVISLRGDGEVDWDEQSQVEGAGLRFVRVPVSSAADLSPESVTALDAALREAGDAPVLLHCGSSNRVGALVALRAAWLEGADLESAIEAGRAAGLSGLEPAVRERLGDTALARCAREPAADGC